LAEADPEALAEADDDTDTDTDTDTDADRDNGGSDSALLGRAPFGEDGSTSQILRRTSRRGVRRARFRPRLQVAEKPNTNARHPIPHFHPSQKTWDNADSWQDC
jgi:hypothetical protein